METLWKAVTESYGTRWIQTAFLPSFLFLSALGAIYIDTFGNWSNTLTWWISLQISVQLILLAATLTVMILFATFLGAVTLGLLQFTEGYWSTFWLGSLMGNKRQHYEGIRDHYQKEFSKIVERETDKGEELTTAEEQEKRSLDEKLRYLPVGARVMPTALGNILLSAEEYPRLRYGLDPLVTWLPFYPSLSSELQGSLADSRSELNLAIKFLYLTAAFGLVVTVVEAVMFGPLWAAIVLGCSALVCFICYRWAIVSAVAYSDLERAAFDLHRFDLYEVLHLPIPIQSGDKERNAGKQLTQFLWRGDVDLTYKHPNPKKPDPSDTSKGAAKD